ncbi:MAG: hypothetical protein DME24_02440 [Verrucomicrobia bacterium]|nr:MAG: hypothetical protein DME24_02440 [Verrucomicrobiota bacterium]
MQNTFRTIGALNFERIVFNSDHRSHFIFLKTTFATMKPDRHAGTVLPHIPFLCLCPRQRIEDLKLLFFTTQPTSDFQRSADFVLGQVLDKVTFGTGQTLMRDGSKHSF